MSYRKIVVNGTIYQYQVGVKYAVILNCQMKKVVPLCDIVEGGPTPTMDLVEECWPYQVHHAHRRQCAVKPSDIERYIKEKL